MFENIAIDGQGRTVKHTFSLGYGVGINIKAAPERIWALLTNAKDFPRWNSTVASIDGDIALGNTIKLKVPYAPGRTFNLRVSEFEPGRKMVWRDGNPPVMQGVRTYTITSKSDGSCDYTMVEILNGLMLPMIAGSLPDQAPMFSKYASDLKAAAQAGV